MRRRKPEERVSARWRHRRSSSRRRRKKKGIEDHFERVNKGSSIIKVQGNESPLWMKLHKEKSRIFSVLLTIFLLVSLSLSFLHTHILLPPPISISHPKSIYICPCINLDASARDSRTRANMSRPRGRKMHDTSLPREKCIIDPWRGLRTARIDRSPVSETSMKMDTQGLAG